jgi:hypothetical protein
VETYRFYFIDANEHIARSREIKCPSDIQAVDMAAWEIGEYLAIQVWKGNQPVSVIGNPRRLEESCLAHGQRPVGWGLRSMEHGMGR